MSHIGTYERVRLRALCDEFWDAACIRAVKASLPALLDALDVAGHERDALRAELVVARVGGVFAALAGQSTRESDAVQWSATVGERDALRAENASLRERIAALEALVGIVP